MKMISAIDSVRLVSSVPESLAEKIRVFLGKLDVYLQSLRAQEREALRRNSHPNSIFSGTESPKVVDRYVSEGEQLLVELELARANPNSIERDLLVMAHGMFPQSKVGIKMGFGETLRVCEDLITELSVALEPRHA